MSKIDTVLEKLEVFESKKTKELIYRTSEGRYISTLSLARIEQLKINFSRWYDTNVILNEHIPPGELFAWLIEHQEEIKGIYKEYNC